MGMERCPWMPTNGGQEPDAPNPDDKFEDAYLQRVLQAVEMNEDTGWCFNCNEIACKEELKHVYQC